METKVCSSCNNVKTMDQFSNDKHKKDGKHIYCKVCRASRVKIGRQDKVTPTLIPMSSPMSEPVPTSSTPSPIPVSNIQTIPGPVHAPGSCGAPNTPEQAQLWVDDLCTRKSWDQIPTIIQKGLLMDYEITGPTKK